jgi:hypothetical protein
MRVAAVNSAPGLGAVIGGKVDLAFAFPALAGADAAGHSGRLTQDPDQADSALRVASGRPGQNLEGGHDQRVPGQKRQRLPIGAMHGRLAAPDVGIVETRHVVMDEARAMNELDRRGCRIGHGRVGIPAGHGDGHADRGANPGTAGIDRVIERGGESGRSGTALRRGNGGGDRRFDPCFQSHEAPGRKRNLIATTGGM